MNIYFRQTIMAQKPNAMENKRRLKKQRINRFKAVMLTTFFHGAIIASVFYGQEMKSVLTDYLPAFVQSEKEIDQEALEKAKEMDLKVKQKKKRKLDPNRS